jgi:hypothetical protein
MKLPTRRKKDRPTELPFTVTNQDGSLQTHTLPVSEHPTTCIMFQFEPEFQPATYDTKIWMGGLDKREVELVRKKYGGKGFTGGAFHPMAFVQMLAKIAHAHAVAVCGLGSFEPLLLNMILNRPFGWGHFVGSRLGEDILAEPFLHLVHLESRTVGTDMYLVAFIRLFAPLGAPRYHVAVGRLTPDSPALEKLRELSPP